MIRRAPGWSGLPAGACPRRWGPPVLPTRAAGQFRRLPAVGPCHPPPPPHRPGAARRFRRELRPTQPPIRACPPGRRARQGRASLPETIPRPGPAPESGARSARAWVVSNLTVVSMAGCGASAAVPAAGSGVPAAARPSALPASRSRRVSERAATRACSEKDGLGASTACRGATTTPRPNTTRARQPKRTIRESLPGKGPCHRFSLVSSFTTDHVVTPVSNSVHHVARKIASLVDTTSSNGRRPAS